MELKLFKDFHMLDIDTPLSYQKKNPADTHILVLYQYHIAVFIDMADGRVADIIYAKGSDIREKAETVMSQYKKVDILPHASVGKKYLVNLYRQKRYNQIYSVVKNHDTIFFKYIRKSLLLDIPDVSVKKPKTSYKMLGNYPVFDFSRLNKQDIRMQIDNLEDHIDYLIENEVNKEYEPHVLISPTIAIFLNLKRNCITQIKNIQHKPAEHLLDILSHYSCANLIFTPDFSKEDLKQILKSKKHKNIFSVEQKNRPQFVNYCQSLRKKVLPYIEHGRLIFNDWKYVQNILSSDSLTHIKNNIEDLMKLKKRYPLKQFVFIQNDILIATENGNVSYVATGDIRQTIMPFLSRCQNVKVIPDKNIDMSTLKQIGLHRTTNTVYRPEAEHADFYMLCASIKNFIYEDKQCEKPLEQTIDLQNSLEQICDSNIWDNKNVHITMKEGNRKYSFNGRVITRNNIYPDKHEALIIFSDASLTNDNTGQAFVSYIFNKRTHAIAVWQYGYLHGEKNTSLNINILEKFALQFSRMNTQGMPYVNYVDNTNVVRNDPLARHVKGHVKKHMESHYGNGGNEIADRIAGLVRQNKNMSPDELREYLLDHNVTIHNEKAISTLLFSR